MTMQGDIHQGIDESKIYKRGLRSYCGQCNIEVELRSSGIWYHKSPIKMIPGAAPDAQAGREARYIGEPKLDITQSKTSDWSLPVIKRPDWDTYFRGIARSVAQRATCPRAKCGAVIVSDDNRILATGYNGSVAGDDHCIDVGCDVVDGHCQRAIHAEANALAYAARYGVAVGGARLYLHIDNGGTVVDVCRECMKWLRAANVRVVSV